MTLPGSLCLVSWMQMMCLSHPQTDGIATLSEVTLADRTCSLGPGLAASPILIPGPKLRHWASSVVSTVQVQRGLLGGLLPYKLKSMVLYG